jgi:integrase/recombinase XerC
MSTPRTFSLEEENRLLKVTAAHAFRDHVVIYLALKTALREHEILALNIGDVFDVDGHVKQTVALRVNKGSVKGQVVFLVHDGLRERLAKLYREKSHAQHDMSHDAPLFVRTRGGGRKRGRVDRDGRLTDRALRAAFTQWQKLAGIDVPLRFHDLRHTACTHYLRKCGGDLRRTQRFARHASITSTQIYTHVTDSEVVETARRM